MSRSSYLLTKSGSEREAKKQGKEIAMNLLLATHKDPVPGVSLPVHSPQPSGRDR